jgi:nucleoside-diphosphate-sugar epimerase
VKTHPSLRDPAPRRYLVTGALGCIGAWTVRVLAEEGLDVIAFDLGGDDYRLRQAVPPELRGKITRISGDVTDLPLIEQVIACHGVDGIIHLAALQVPACATDPVRGASVNVTGTLTVFEAAKRRLTGGAPVVYASSVAAYGGDGGGRDTPGDLSCHPHTHYGVFKRANEGSAFVYWHSDGIASIGLRPYVVYGPGRDRGMTSEPTQAMLAAARGEGYHLSFGGRCRMQYVEDVARSFVCASRSAFRGAEVADLAGTPVHMRDIVAAIEAAAPEVSGRISYDDRPLPFPAGVTPHTGQLFRVPDETPLLAGVGRTIARFRDYLAEPVRDDADTP